MAEIGAILDGKYEILKLIGKGGMSKVYLATDIRLNKQWAVKEVEKFALDPVKNEVVVNSAIAEANLIKQLDNFYLPRINDIIDNGKTIYVVMDFVEGESLQEILRRRGAQDEKQIIKWGKQICEVLNYLHGRRPPIIYRDLKPGNVMIKPDGDIKLIDFGIAREYKERAGSDTTSLGTRGYAAPEQFAGGTQTDARTDIYNLGATLYHAVTGHDPSKEPYVMYPIRYWNPKLSGGLENIILKCTKQNPEDRYQTALEVFHDLTHYKEIDNIYRKKQRNKVRNFILAAGLCVFFVGFSLLSMGISSSQKNKDYLGWINSAIGEDDPEKKLDDLSNAIRIEPTRKNAYMEVDGEPSVNIVDVFAATKDDVNYFTAEEQKIFNEFKSGENYPKSLSDTLENEDWYPDLALRIGELYWYNYTGNVGETLDARWDASPGDRKKLSVEWFNQVDSRTPTIEAFFDVGTFVKDVEGSKKDKSGTTEFKDGWDKLDKAYSSVTNDAEATNRAKLSVYDAIVSAIINNGYNFQDNGVGVDEMKELFAKVKAETDSMEGNIGQGETITQALYKNITGKYKQMDAWLDKLSS